jgi:PadR family transcriptional regulator PadR
MMNSRAEISGADVGRATKLASGTLYPILFRLENAGWVSSEWEPEEPQELGRPRRRLYRITGVGARKARAAIRDIQHSFGDLAWQS